MKVISTISSFLIVFLLTASIGVSQEVYLLNSVDTLLKQVEAKTLMGHPQERTYFSINNEPLEQDLLQVGDVMEVVLSESVSTELTITRIETYTKNTLSIFAKDEFDSESTFTFTYSNGALNGIFHRSHDDVFFFEFDPDAGQNYVAKSSPFYDDEHICTVHDLESENHSQQTGFNQALTLGNSSVEQHVPNLSAMASSLEDEITIDILIPYTENARIWAEESTFNSIDVLISSAMSLSQTALDNSDVFINLRLVHYYETNYKGDSLEKLDEDDLDFVSGGTHLRRLSRNPDNPFNLCPSDADCEESDFDGYMEEVHPLRDEFGADLVAAFLSEPNTGGIAWVSSSTAGRPSRGFSVNRAQQVGVNYTLIHEIGHNMGNVHARNQEQAAAGDFGGIFQYSTGNRFTTTSGDSLATVMAYTQGGYTGIPHFSNPDITFSGSKTGNRLTFTGEAGPSDNARSMREIKRVIASYRPTMVDSPVVDVEESSIAAVLNQENSTITVPVTIRNKGDSDLMWDLDFDIESEVLARQKARTVTETIEPASDFQQYSSGNLFAQDEENGAVFSVEFSDIEGFSLGDHTAIMGWRAFSTQAPFELSGENPTAGNRHLRLPHRSETSSSVFARSPFFGPQPMGEFSVTFDMATQNQTIGDTLEVFDMYIFDGSTASISAGIIISRGTMFVRTLNETGEEVFGNSGTNFPADGSYQSMEIRFNPNNRSIDYYMNGSLFTSSPYPTGKKPDYIFFGQRNDVAGAYMDVDNVDVRRLHTPFNWLSVDNNGGVIEPSSSQTVDLTLTAIDVETGTYQTVLQVHSNDPENPVIELPIMADIELATSTEADRELPGKISLEQNYPNPFNPTTTIQFNLNRAEAVRLDVYNITGQKVATLVQDVMNAGSHELKFDARGFASGIYIYRLQTPSESLTRQMILIK